MDADRRLRWGFSLFCDDFRPEIGGKVSLMGIYQSDYIFQGPLPHLAPKFGILIMYYEFYDAPEQKLEFRVFLPSDDPEKPTITFPLDRENAPRPEKLPLVGNETEEDSERIFHARIPIIFSPLLLPKAGRIKVRAAFGDGTILRLGSLMARPATDDESKVLFGVPAPPPPSA
jgi:hypothetical protein